MDGLIFIGMGEIKPGVGVFEIEEGAGIKNLAELGLVGEGASVWGVGS